MTKTRIDVPDDIAAQILFLSDRTFQKYER